jgi:hypothetical protein
MDRWIDGWGDGWMSVGMNDEWLKFQNQYLPGLDLTKLVVI